MNEKEIEKASRKVESLLLGEIERCATYEGRLVGLNDEKITVIKDLIYNVIKSMELSVAINSKINDLPHEVVFCSLIEAIEGWNQKINELSADRKNISRN